MNRSKFLRLTLFLIVSFCLISSHKVNAVPAMINFQGVLRDPAGNPLTGTQSITFSFYGAETGGSSLWSETQTVTVGDGLFNVILGSVTPIAMSIFDGNPRYLAVKVGTDPEMTPRIALVTVPYAFHAGVADTVATGTGSASCDAYVLKAGDTMTGTLTIEVSAGDALSAITNSNTNLSAAVRGESTTTATPITYGGRFISYADSGRGVSGVATGTSGRGVSGSVNAFSGVNYGGYFESYSPNGYGILARNMVGGRAGFFQGGIISTSTIETSGGIKFLDGTTQTTAATGGASGAFVRLAGDAMSGTLTVDAVNAINARGSDRGIYSSVALENGYGVYATNEASGTIGYLAGGADGAYGVYGTAGGVGGCGVLGNAILGNGVFGQSGSAAKAGVYGTNSAESGAAYGVFGSAYSSSGYGVYGLNTSATGTGVYGYNTSTGVGVYGENASSGKGVYGYNTSTGYGVYGKNTSTGYGVWGNNNSTGSGVFGNNDSTGNGVTGYTVGGNGVLGLAQSDGAGVYGLNTSTGPGGLFKNNVGGLAGEFVGPVRISGTIEATGLYGGSAATAINIDASNRLFRVTSSRRYKTEITDLEIDTNKIYGLRPVSFRFKQNTKRDFGLIAEEVAEVIPELVAYNLQDQPESVRYEQLSVLLLNEVKKMKKANQELEARLKAVEDRLNK